MLKLLHNNTWRHTLSVMIAVTIAIVVAYFYSRTSIALIPLTTAFVMQTAIGNSLYQGLLKFLILFFLVMITALYVHSMQFFYWEMHDVLLGAVMGVAANILIFPRKPDVEFRQKASHTLLIYQHYLNQIFDRMRQKHDLSNNAEVENAIINLPGWVYESGFDAGLKTGYRFFLIKLEQIADVLFSLHYLARFSYERDLLLVVDKALDDCKMKINHVFTSLAQVMQLKHNEPVEDFAPELEALEKEFYQLAPKSLELLDIRLEYVYFAEFIYCLWELQRYLQRLGESLQLSDKKSRVD